jgi:branched-chain amino acid transport system permease protein
MSYIFHIVIFLCIYSMLSLSLNMIVGLTGMFNLGHIAFFGIGAYCSALLAFQGFPFLACLFLGALLAGAIGYFIGISTLKLKGDYLAIATLGLGEFIRSVFNNWMGLTRGPMGLPGIPKPTIFSLHINSTESYLILALIFFFLTFLIMEKLFRSPYGRVLKGIREDEFAAQALGKDVYRFKLHALFLGCFFAGMAGSLYAHYISFIDPSTFTIQQTIFILIMVVLGGMGNNIGAILGAVIIILLPELLRLLNLPGHVTGPLKQMIFSLLLILLMLFRPRGILGREKSRVERFEEVNDNPED